MTDNSESCCKHGAKLDRIIELLKPRKPKTIGFENGPIGIDVKNGSGYQDCVWVYSDGTHYSLSYHGLVKKVPVKDFRLGMEEVEAVRQELEEQLKSTPPSGRTDDGRPYWL